MFDHYANDERLMLEYFIGKGYMPEAFQDRSTTIEWKNATNIELIIRPQCNQQCEYCYITQHGNELYPKETWLSNAQILKNINMILDWVIRNKWFVQRFELFAGDLFFDNLYYDILEVFYEKYNSIPKAEWNDCLKKWKVVEIVTPSNGAYLYESEHQNKLREYTAKLATIGLRPGISWSTDGLYAAGSREEAGKLDYKIEQAYYDKIFPFIKEMNYGFHPMVAPENVDISIKNFDWWVQMYQNYHFNDKKGYFYPPLLEVRNDYWTTEQIFQFTELLRHMWDYKFQLNNNSAQKMARHLLVGDGEDNSLERLAFYDPCIIIHNNKPDITCGMSNLLRINLANMSLPTCHRLTYPQFTGGFFEIAHDKIIGIKPCRGTSMWMNLRLMDPKFYPKCNSCDYQYGCLQGCLGAQYESSGEILKPCDSVCALEQAKINTLLELYNDFDIIKIGEENGYFHDPNFHDWLKRLSKQGGFDCVEC